MAHLLDIERVGKTMWKTFYNLGYGVTAAEKNQKYLNKSGLLFWGGIRGETVDSISIILNYSKEEEDEEKGLSNKLSRVSFVSNESVRNYKHLTGVRYAVSVYLRIVIFRRRDRHGNSCKSSLLPFVRGIGPDDVNVLFYDKVDGFVTGNKTNKRLWPRNARILFYLPLKSVLALPHTENFRLKCPAAECDRVVYCIVLKRRLSPVRYVLIAG